MRTVAEEFLVFVDRGRFSGGFASVHTVTLEGEPFLYKQYSAGPSVPRKHLIRLHETDFPPEVRARLAVPECLVVADHAVAGFLMRSAPERFFAGVAPRSLSRLGRDEYTEGQRLAVLGSLLELILEAHAAGYVVGDLKPKNVLITAPNDPVDPVFMVDVDTFSFRGDPLRQQPYTETMLPPDLYDQPMTTATDLYQFALLVERTLIGDYSTYPDRSPLPEAAAGAMYDWHRRLLDRWKALAPTNADDALDLAATWRSLWTTHGHGRLRSNTVQMLGPGEVWPDTPRVAAADPAAPSIPAAPAHRAAGYDPSQGQPGQPGYPPTPPAEESRTGLVIGIVIAVVVLLGALVVGGLFLRAPKKLDDKALETQIAADLTARVGSTVTVDCPADQPVQNGYTFNCTATDVSGTTVTISVTEDDDKGTVTWEVVG